MIGEYTNLHRYTDGIWLAENYLQYFLNAFTLSGHIAAVVPFWRFDTYYYILTMYDHVGNTAKCQEYLKKCQENISCVNRSWEHIDYYFGFCIGMPLWKSSKDPPDSLKSSRRPRIFSG